MYFMKAMDAIYADGLTKRYGDTLVLDRLDPAVAPGEVYGYLGPERGRQDHNDPTPARTRTGPTAGHAALFGVDAWRDPVTHTVRWPTSPASRRYGRR